MLRGLLRQYLPHAPYGFARTGAIDLQLEMEELLLPVAPPVECPPLRYVETSVRPLRQPGPTASMKGSRENFRRYSLPATRLLLK